MPRNKMSASTSMGWTVTEHMFSCSARGGMVARQTARGALEGMMARPCGGPAGHSNCSLSPQMRFRFGYVLADSCQSTLYVAAWPARTQRTGEEAQTVDPLGIFMVSCGSAGNPGMRKCHRAQWWWWWWSIMYYVRFRVLQITHRRPETLPQMR